MRVYLDNGIPYREWRCQQIRWQADELEMLGITSASDLL